MATAYTAPEYSRSVIESEVGATPFYVEPYDGGILAKLVVSADTMLIGKLPSLCRILDGWFADELTDTNGTATNALKLDITDGTLTKNLMAARTVNDSGAQTHTRFTEITDALGYQLVNTNRNYWDILITNTNVAATAGTVGIIKCFILYQCFDSYAID